MWHTRLCMVLLAILVSSNASRDRVRSGKPVKTSVFHSPPFVLKEGSVANKFYLDIPFPRGHIAIKNFHAEVVDEMGTPIPLHETYLHHWLVERYYSKKGSRGDFHFSDFKYSRNDGICNNTLSQQFGLGSETRKTSTWVPDPYGIEFGNPSKIPSGYEERWFMNVHAIDTREVKDKLGCTECKCSLYNVTDLQKDYIGGLHCCYDRMQCQLRDGFNGGNVRKLYLKYSVEWVEWDASIVPVKIYIFDVTGSGSSELYRCATEYNIEPCDIRSVGDGKCIDTRQTSAVVPQGGDIVYGVAHQHAGGVGASLYGQDGRILCSSTPTYGDGHEAGNESGYIVGMSTCYPKPGSVSISDGELLTVVSNYNSNRLHTGVMGLFYILVSEPQNSILTNTRSIVKSLSIPTGVKEIIKHWWAFATASGVLVAAIIVGYLRRYDAGGYQSL